MKTARLHFDFCQKYRSAEVRATGAFYFGECQVQAVMGDSGAGKTSFARWIVGLGKGAAGRLEWEDETLFDSRAGVNLKPPQRRFGYLPQADALFPHLTVAENITYGLRRLGKEAKTQRLAELSTSTGTGEFLEKRPGELSGGERRRVALAQALAVRPRLLLLDEPFTGLDRKAKEILWAETRAFLAKEGVPAILITHEEAEARAFTNRIFRFEERILNVR